MTFTKEKVADACVVIAPTQKFDPLLILAVCLQEGGKKNDKRASEGWVFTPDRARLEQGFYLRYVEGKNELATSTEVLLAASYGVMQIMGLELFRLGFFEFYFHQCSPGLQSALKGPRSQFGIVSGIDAFCENLSWQIEWGCKLMAEKRSKAGGDINKMLLFWNGGGNKQYDDEVLEKYNKLKEPA
jgi:hypothetical protein